MPVTHACKDGIEPIGMAFDKAAELLIFRMDIYAPEDLIVGINGTREIMIAYAVRVVIAAEVIIQIVSETDADLHASYRAKAQLRSNSKMEGVA